MEKNLGWPLSTVKNFNQGIFNGKKSIKKGRSKISNFRHFSNFRQILTTQRKSFPIFSR